MLTHLQIRDFAIIDLIELEVRARPHRAHRRNRRRQVHHRRRARIARRRQGGAEVWRAGTERAETFRTFDISECPKALRDILTEQSVEAEDELTVRRVISGDGRSRGYLNGVSVPLQLLRDVAASSSIPRPT